MARRESEQTVVSKKCVAALPLLCSSIMVAERETRRQRRRREVAQADDADAGDGVAHDAKRIRMDDDGDHGKGEAPASNGGVDEAVGAERPELDGTERAELDDDEVSFPARRPVLFNVLRRSTR